MSATLLNQILTPILLLLLSAGFFSAWLYERSWTSAAFFSVSYVLLTVGFMFETLLKPHTDSVALRVLADMIYGLIGVFFLLGIQRRFRIPNTWLLAGLLFCAVWAGLSYYRFITPDLLSRARVATWGAGISIGIAAVHTFANGRSFADRVLMVFLGLFAISISLSTYLTGHIDGKLTSDNFAGSVTLAVINLLMAASALAAAITLLLDFILSAHSRIRRQSETDELTGLLNRRGFETAVMSSLRRHPDTALILADLDHFKAINDTHGHAAGDDALRHFAQILRSTVRQSDLCGRIGGEEFCILLPGASARGAGGMAERIRERLHESRLPNLPETCQLTASFGVAQAEKGDDYGALFNRADKALYKAKNDGRDKVTVAG